MKIYRVGGAVRDRLLGLAVQDHDYVVVGASPEQMVAAGYVPVGRDFPVFLHPATKEEYALARTERKSGRGYQGFVFHAAHTVTLEEDLARRDLTINAMAEDAAGNIVDPYGGQRDLAARVLRHVGPAFEEDPVRVLRLARFAARFADFSIAPETFALLQRMVAIGEVDHLVPERVWQELARGLSEQHPSRMLQVLHDCGALARIAAPFEHYWHEDRPGAHVWLAALDRAAHAGLSVPQRFAVLASGVDHAPGTASPILSSLCDALRIPGEDRDLAIMLAREWALIGVATDAAAMLALIERCDAVRRPARFAQLLQAWTMLLDPLRRSALLQAAHGHEARLLAALKAARGIDAGAAARAAATPGEIPARVRGARLQAIEALPDLRGGTTVAVPIDLLADLQAAVFTDKGRGQ